jgi:hypothetical protein
MHTSACGDLAVFLKPQNRHLRVIKPRLQYRNNSLGRSQQMNHYGDHYPRAWRKTHHTLLVSLTQYPRTSSPVSTRNEHQQPIRTHEAAPGNEYTVSCWQVDISGRALMRYPSKAQRNLVRNSNSTNGCRRTFESIQLLINPLHHLACLFSSQIYHVRAWEVACKRAVKR